MPLAFIIIGALIIVTAYQGTYKDFGNQLVTDFSGSGSFIYWVAAVAIIGMLGYVKVFRTPARMLLALIVIAFFLANKGGVFSQFTSALQNIQPDTNAVTEPTAPGALPITISGGTGSGLSGALSSLTKLGSGTGSAASTASTVASGTGGLY